MPDVTKVYETRDRRTILTIMATGLDPIGVRRVENTCYFSFNKAEVDSIVSKYLAGEPILVNVHRFWRSEDYFKSQLNGK